MRRCSLIVLAFPHPDYSKPAGRLHAGYQIDVAVGWNYAHYRWYNPYTGQWVTEDPILLDAGPNPREYVNDEPTNATDPTGQYLVVQDGAQVNWLKTLSDMGIAAKAYPLPAEHWWSSERWIILTSQAEKEKLANLANDPAIGDDWTRNLYRALGLGGNYSVEGNKDLGIVTTTFGRRERHEIQQYRAMRDDAANYRRGEYVSGAQMIDNATVEGLHGGAIIVGNRLSSTFSLGQWTPLQQEAEKLIAENGGAYKWADASARIGAEAAFMLVLPPAVKGVASGVARGAAVVPGVAQVGAKLAQAGKGVLALPYLGRTVMVTFKVAEVGAAGLQGKQMYDNLMEGIQHWQNGDTEGAVGAFGAAGVDGIGLLNTLQEMARAYRGSGKANAPRTMPAAGQRGIWDIASDLERGAAAEARLGGRTGLHFDFPVIDRFENGVATSVKTMDLGRSSYQNVQQITSTGQRYIDAASGFATRGPVGRAGRIIQPSQVTQRAVDLVVPPWATPAQRQALQGLVEYGARQNPPVVVRIVEMQ